MNVLITVSPAPVTSAISSVPWIGMNVAGSVALEQRHAAAAPRDQEQARVEAFEHRRARLLDGRARRPSSWPVSSSTSARWAWPR